MLNKAGLSLRGYESRNFGKYYISLVCFDLEKVKHRSTNNLEVDAFHKTREKKKTIYEVCKGRGENILKN